MVDFGREICGHLAAAQRREWLVTNGIGGFAMGSLPGMLTRRYHALLVAALRPPLGRTVLLSKLDDSASYDGRLYPLFTNQWADGPIEPAGYTNQQRFHLEGTTPVWTFALANAVLEKRIWMQPEANTTYIHYHLVRASGPLRLEAKALVTYRDYHGNTTAGALSFSPTRVERGLRLDASPGLTPLYLLSDRAELRPENEWYRGFLMAVEEQRGQPAEEDLYLAATFFLVLQPGENVTLIASTSSAPSLDGEAAYEERRSHEAGLLAGSPLEGEPPALRQLTLAADQFIVRRAAPGDPDGRTIIAGYPWFSDWGRDTMISLPGLTLATGRSEVAARILRTFAPFVSQGMLPNRFPDAGETPEYNTVDATLWYFEAIRAYHEQSGDDSLLADLFPTLAEIVAWHKRGTRYQIHMDPADSLIYAGENGVQLTWMDAKVGDWVVTPRIGKPVEINALWYHALRTLAEFARRLARPLAETEEYDALADRVRASFVRFWNPNLGVCYDVLDGPGGDDAALRPNQLLAVSLPHSPLDERQQRAVVDACAARLLTSYGLRSLSPDDPAFIGDYGGDQRKRDAAYHQGTVWGWLIGPFVAAHLRVYRDPAAARSFLLPFFHHLADHGLGSISEIFEGNAPFVPRGCPAQAWSVAEVLRAWRLTAE
jgi:predicted glycogen debranching enzyme